MSTFHSQGAVPIDVQSYMTRRFEEIVFQEVLSNRWVLLLGPRQHGKSTGLVRLRRQLQEIGFLTARIDLQGLPPCDSFQQFLKRVTDQICKSLGLPGLEYPHIEDQDDFISWLRTNIPQAQSPIVIMIDEAASIEDSRYRNAFYGQIRQISSLRADANEVDIPARVRFIFAGTFRPETLVQEQNSPFNVCQVVLTEDVSLDQAKEMVAKVNANLVPLVEQAYDLVGGQPYLLQTMFAETTREPEKTLEEGFAHTVADLQHLVAQHLEGIFSKIISSPSLVQKVSTMVQRGATALIPADSDCSFLQTMGLAKREGTTLVFRNRFYFEVAQASPQLLSSPPEVPVGTTVFRLDKASFSFMNNASLLEIAFSAYDGGVKAHNSGNYRLALTGFGSATEAVLIDLLLGLSARDLQNAITSALTDADHSKRPRFNNFEVQADALTWRLVNLINVARKVRVGSSSPEPSHALREWRNLVHPAAAMQNFVDESRLQPESTAAAAMFAMLVRDIAHRQP